MNYVYLMRSGERYKIGRAHDVERRWRTFRTADPAIRIEHVIPCHQASVLEAELHRRFDHQHIDLEWFRLSPGDVMFIKSLGGNAGRWLESRQVRRRRWRKLARLARGVAWLGLKLFLLAVLIYISWRALAWALPQLQHLRIKI